MCERGYRERGGQVADDHGVGDAGEQGAARDGAGDDPERVLAEGLLPDLFEALRFVQCFETDWPLLIDSPELGDPFLNEYGAWPTRFFLVKGNQIVFLSEPNEEHRISEDDLKNAIEISTEVKFVK